MLQPQGASSCCCCQVTSAVSDSVRPQRPQSTRLPIPGTLQASTLEWGAIAFSTGSLHSFLKPNPFADNTSHPRGPSFFLENPVSQKKEKERKSSVRKSPQAWSFPHFISQQPALCFLARGFTRPSSELCHKRGIQVPIAPVKGVPARVAVQDSKSDF